MLAGVHEVADRLDVSRQRVHQLAAQPGFPAPIAELAAGLIWDMDHIERWTQQVRTTAEVPLDRIPARDPDRPQNDPWDADALDYLLAAEGGQGWTKGDLMECLREQSNRVARQPQRVEEAARHARRHGVDRRRDEPDGKTIHFFRSDANAPQPYPSTAAERRAWLKAEREHRR